MRTRFVVAFADPLPPEKERALVDFIAKLGLHWWNPTAELWLLIDPKGGLTSIGLRDQLQLRDDLQLECLVIDVPAGERAAWFGPPSKFEWMLDYWSTDKNDVTDMSKETRAPETPAPSHQPKLSDQFKRVD